MTSHSMSRRIALAAAAAGAALSMSLAVAGPASAAPEEAKNRTTVSVASPQPTVQVLAPNAVTPPAGTRQVFLGVAFGISGPTVSVNAPETGRHAVRYDTSELPTALNTIIDGTYLQQVGAGSDSTVYTQPFRLAAGHHTVGLGGPETYSPANAYLVGPF